MVLLREGYIYVYFLTDLCTDQLIFKARDEAAGTDRQRIILSLSALERNTVYKALEVELDHIALLNCSVIYIDGSGVILALLIDSPVSTSSSVTSTGVCLLYLYALVIAQSYFRL